MSNGLPSPYDTRVAAVRDALRDAGIDCLVVSSRQNVRYLVGFAGSSGWVLVSATEAILATDSRYVEGARRDLGENCVHLAADLHSFAVSYVSGCSIATLGFEGEHLSYREAGELQNKMTASGVRCRLTATDGVIESLRMVKDADELGAVQRAAELADGAIAHAKTIFRCGMTERELAWQVERWMREHGSGPMPFDVIVASGPNSSLPHAVPGERRLAEGEPVVIDLGARWDGYCSDLTRTLFLGHMPPAFERIYRVVLKAHKTALAGARSGMTTAEVDELARAVVRRAGLADLFTHGLGHGVGLEVHEKPTVNSRSADRLVDGVVFTIEPGVYLPGLGGVRIEDTVVMRHGKPQSFSSSDKEDPTITVHAGLREA